MTQTCVELQSFCRIIQGGRHGLSGNNFVPNGYPAYGAGGLNGYLATHEFDEPAVVLSSIGARCGKCFFADGKWSSLANTQIIIPDPQRANAKFLWFQLNDENRWHRSGTGQPFIKPADVKMHRVVLPPLSDQQRIVNILDSASGLKAKRGMTLVLLDKIIEALFFDMFGDPGVNPKKWPQKTLGELITVGPQNGLYKPSSDYGTGTPILRIDAFYDGAVTRLDNLKRVRLSDQELDLYGLREGEIVVNRVNSREYLGKSAIIPPLREITVFESNMMRFDVNRAIIDTRYLIQFLQTHFVRSHILRSAKDAVNQSSINQQDVKAIPINVPPLELQQAFVTRVAAVIMLKTGHVASFNQLGVLFNELKHFAFGGGL